MLEPYSHEVFRNFATSIESQNLMDDLVSDPAIVNRLTPLHYKSSASPSPVERVLNKSERQIIQDEIDAKFQPSHWYESRYSDGSWSVIYSAESEETALREVLFHLHEFYREELQDNPITVERRVVTLKIKTDQALDLTIKSDLDAQKLTSKDKSGYGYCQKIAKAARENGASLLRTPSARHTDGICIPIFEKNVIQEDRGHLKHLKCTLRKEGDTKVVGVQYAEPVIISG